MGVKFLAFNVLLHTKSEHKVILFFCAPIIFKNQLKYDKKYTITIYVGRVWIVIGYFLFEKQSFNGLRKVIGMQKVL